MEKTTYETRVGVETISVLPRTLEIDIESMRFGTVDSPMYVVRGTDPADRKVWCATFIDEQEAEAWVHGSKTFGRPILGAVLAGQDVTLVKGGEMSDDAVAVGTDSGTTPEKAS